MEKGKLVISLDFELLWGVFDKVDYKEKIRYFENTRKVIPEILQVFTDYEISCTWAIVGMLFNRNWKDWEESVPKEQPAYENEQLSAYRFGKSISTEGTENLCFSPDLIRQIKATPGQEIGTHTYSHYYCSEKGQTSVSFKYDLEAAILKAEEIGVELNSLVFPRNQLNGEYLRVCFDSGIKTVRSNPSNWYWKETQNSSFLKKLFRTGDAYIGRNNKSYSLQSLKREEGKPVEQPASRLLRPISTKKFLNNLRMKRIKSEMLSAAKRNEVYHLWWHPHNFGEHPRESISELREIGEHFQMCKNKYGFESMNMEDLSALV